MDFANSLVILVKVDECTVSWSLLTTVYWSRDEDGIGWSKCLMEFILERPYIYYYPPLLRGMAHLVRDTAVKKEFDFAI